MIYFNLIQRGRNPRKSNKRRGKKGNSMDLDSNGREFVKTIDGTFVPIEFVKPSKDKEKERGGGGD